MAKILAYARDPCKIPFGAVVIILDGFQSIAFEAPLPFATATAVSSSHNMLNR